MLKLFVSSTFSDMQAERDIIRNIVIPKVQEHVRKIGQEISLVDFRWGITSDTDDETESMSKILSVCVNEIANCKPFFILLIGNKYGTIPSPEAIEKFLEDKEIEWNIKNKSITEIEMHCAEKSGFSKESIIICMRDEKVYDSIPRNIRQKYVKDDENKESLKAFKKYVEEKYKDNIIKYKAKWNRKTNSLCELDDFAYALENKILQIINSENNNVTISIEQQQEEIEKNEIINNAEKYADLDKNLSKAEAFLENKDQVLIIKGESGSGKTALISKLHTDLLSNDQYQVVSLLLKNTVYDLNLHNMHYQLAYRLNKLVDNPIEISKEMNYSEIKKVVRSLINKITESKKLILIFDDVSEMEYNDRISFLSELYLPTNKSYKLIITHDSEIEIPVNALIKKRFSVLHIKNQYHDLSLVIKNMCKKYSKELNQNVLDIMVSKVIFKSPLYASLALKKLLLLSEQDFERINELSKEGVNGEEALNQYMIETIRLLPSSTDKLAINLFEKLHELYGVDKVYTFLHLLLASNEELTIGDFVNIMSKSEKTKMSFLDITVMMNLLEEIFARRGKNDSVKFAHNCLEKAFREKYCNSMINYKQQIYEYLREQDDSNVLKEKLYIVLGLELEQYNDIIKFLIKNNKEKTFKGYIYFSKLFDNPEYRNNILKKFYEIIDISKTLNINDFRAVVSEVTDTIFGLIVNYYTFDTVELKNLMAYIYEQASPILYHEARTSEDENLCKRTLYMIAEKCGDLSSGTEQYQYYLEFRTMSGTVAQFMSPYYQYYEYILSDYALASFKYFNVVRFSENADTEIFEELVRSSSSMKKASEHCNPRNDKIDFLRYSIAIDCCAIACEQMERWEMEFKMYPSYLDDIYSTFSVCDEILLAEEYFENAVKNYDPNIYSHRLTDYKFRLYETYKVISEMMQLGASFGHYRNLLDYIEKEEKALYDLYENDGNIIIYDRIRQLEYRKGRIKKLSPEKRIESLAKARKITIEIMEKIPTAMQYHSFLGKLDMDILLTTFELLSKYLAFKQTDILEISYEEIKIGILYGIESLNYDVILPIVLPYIQNCKSLNDYDYYESYKTKLFNVENQIKEVIITLLEKGKNKVRRLYNEMVLLYNKTNKTEEETMYLQQQCEDIIDYVNTLYDIIEKVVTETKEQEEMRYVFINVKAIVLIGASAAKILSITTNSEKARQLDIICTGKLHYYMNMCEMLLSKPVADYIFEDAMKDMKYSNYLTLALGDLEFVNKFIGIDKFIEQYLKTNNKHWYNAYHELIAFNIPNVVDKYNLIGKRLCSLFHLEKIKEVIKNSNFYELIALEYAYKNGNYELAHQIIENGYDNYLELGTLYIIRQYDSERYYQELKQLKPICIERRRKEISSFGSYKNIKEIYGNSFCDEFLRLTANEE